ncbi:MAG: hypothetical protein GY765_04435 [bacterium]|nr:hypothetical protein [bacterium]
MGPEALHKLIKKYMPKAVMISMHTRRNYEDRLNIRQVLIEYRGKRKQFEDEKACVRSFLPSGYRLGYEVEYI